MTALHAPSRPTLNHRPCFLSGMTVIPRLEVWPINGDDDFTYISAFLPLANEKTWIARHFECLVEIDSVPDIIRNFRRDPEGTLEELFKDCNGKPQLREGQRVVKQASAAAVSAASLFDSLSESEPESAI